MGGVKTSPFFCLPGLHFSRGPPPPACCRCGAAPPATPRALCASRHSRNAARAAPRHNASFMWRGPPLYRNRPGLPARVRGCLGPRPGAVRWVVWFWPRPPCARLGLRLVGFWAARKRGLPSPPPLAPAWSARPALWSPRPAGVGGAPSAPGGPFPFFRPPPAGPPLAAPGGPGRRGLSSFCRLLRARPRFLRAGGEERRAPGAGDCAACGRRWGLRACGRAGVFRRLRAAAGMRSHALACVGMGWLILTTPQSLRDSSPDKGSQEESLPSSWPLKGKPLAPHPPVPLHYLR